MSAHEADRAMVIQWARERVAARDFVIVATETTGLSEAEIIEVGIVSAEGLPLLDVVLQPQMNIPVEASQIHHITDAHVAHALHFLDVYPCLVKLLTGKHLIAYNAPFVMGMLAGEYQRHQVSSIAYGKVSCAMDWYAQFYGLWNEKRGIYYWQKLPGGEHAAGKDCLAILQVLETMAAARLPDEPEPVLEPSALDDFPF